MLNTLSEKLKCFITIENKGPLDSIFLASVTVYGQCKIEKRWIGDWKSSVNVKEIVGAHLPDVENGFVFFNVEPVVLFCEEVFQQGESVTYSYSCNIPHGVPSTFHGMSTKISYFLSVIIQKDINANEEYIRIPVEILNPISGIEEFSDGYINDSRPVSELYEPLSPFLARLNSDDRPLLNHRISDILESQHLDTNYIIEKQGKHLVLVIIDKTKIEIGDDIRIILDFTAKELPCFQVIAKLECHEIINEKCVSSYRKHMNPIVKIVDEVSKLTLTSIVDDMQLNIPITASPELLFPTMNVSWILKLEFFTGKVNSIEVMELKLPLRVFIHQKSLPYQDIIKTHLLS